MPSFRVIQSGHIFEVYEYQASMKKPNDDPFLKSSKGGRDKEGKEDRKMEYRETVNHRARQKVRRLINANFNQDDLFITVTFAENMTDIDKANYELKKFFQKMKRRQNDFKYVAVIEFQKRGAIHYHMLCNWKATWSNREELQAEERKLGEIWGHGFVDIGYKKTDNAGAYLIKYLSKQHLDERLEGKKRYFFSRNLEQPRELTGGEAVAAIKTLQNQFPVFTSTYYGEFTGEVSYREYNPKRITTNILKEKFKNYKKTLVRKPLFNGVCRWVS